MIFLSVGTQLPFDRLVKLVDSWAEMHPSVEVFGQIGRGGGYRPKFIESCAYLNQNEFKKNLEASELFITHAGMGNIINGLILSKPMIVFPRFVELGEHRNDHQRATCSKFEKFSGVNIADCDEDFDKLMDSRAELRLGALEEYCTGPLVDQLRLYMNS